MSAPRSSTVWVTPASTNRGLKSATMDGPVEAGRLPVAGERWHEPRDVDSRLRSRTVRLLAGYVFRKQLRFSHLTFVGKPSLNKELHWTLAMVISICKVVLHLWCRIRAVIRTLFFTKKKRRNKFRIRRLRISVAKFEVYFQLRLKLLQASQFP